MGWLSRLAAVLAHPRFPWAAALCGALLASPALGHGLALDDHLHQLYVGWVADGQAPGHWWDLYSVATGDVQANRAAMELGATPWWTVPELRVHFLRPVSAATHHLDHRLWPQSLWAMHAQSLLWYGALIVAVGTLLRRWLGPTWVAGLATLLFAVDDAHATAAAWLAQRNALIAATLVVCALIVHDKWRRDSWSRGRWIAPLLWALALLAGEVAIAGLAYLLAYALWLEPYRDLSFSDRVRRFFASLAPYLAVVVAWRWVYVGLGYGAYGSGVYLDPLAEPVAFFTALPDRVSALFVGQLGTVASDGWALLPMPWSRARLLALGGAAAGALVLGPGLRRERGAWVCVAGAMLALVPAATAIPSDRLLTLVGVGAFGAVAWVVAVAAGHGEHSMPTWRRAAAGLLAVPLLVVHLGMAAVGLPRAVVELPRNLEETHSAALEGLPRDAELADQVLVIVNSPPTIASASLWLPRSGETVVAPRAVRILGSTFAPVIVQRPDSSTLILQPVGGYLADPFTTMVRGPTHPLRVGDSVQLDGVVVEILGMAQARPTVVKASFDVPLDDRSLRLVTWQGDRFGPFVPPGVGGTTVSPTPGSR